MHVVEGILSIFAGLIAISTLLLVLFWIVCRIIVQPLLNGDSAKWEISDNDEEEK